MAHYNSHDLLEHRAHSWDTWITVVILELIQAHKSGLLEPTNLLAHRTNKAAAMQAFFTVVNHDN